MLVLFFAGCQRGVAQDSHQPLLAAPAAEDTDCESCCAACGICEDFGKPGPCSVCRSCRHSCTCAAGLSANETDDGADQTVALEAACDSTITANHQVTARL